MSTYTLTLLDTIGIQEYIFASNRLQENIGASELVYRATSLWAFAALETAGITRHNIKNPAGLDWEFSAEEIEKSPDLQAEVIQAAGGNTVILFRDKQQAKGFVQKLTLRLLKEAPGLTLLAQHTDFHFEKDRLSEKRSELEAAMRAHKLSYPGSLPTLGLGVTAMCDSTGLPAVRTLAGKIKVEGKEEPLGLPGEDLEILISREVIAKRAWRSQANRRLKVSLKFAADDFEFPYDIDKLGRIKGDESYVAVVHADGNKIGEHVRQATAGAKTNREWINASRAFSQKINAVSLAALQSVVGLVVQAVKNDAVPYVEEDGKKYLPFRPLVFGGDDVTFVCNGAIGVSLAVAYLEAFQREAEKHSLTFFSSAGVSIVKMHYPFARAYKLSEELTASAKTLTRPEDCSALDWHFAQSGLSGSLENIRKREYLSNEGNPLCLRPLTLETGERSWKNVEIIMDEFNDKWGDKHNKVIGLREHLRKGSGAVEIYRQDFALDPLPGISGVEAQETGWQNGVCYYFDAIELLDHHVSLKNKEAV